jgi:uncharacterized membrane protein (DUF2068 family)
LGYEAVVKVRHLLIVGTAFRLAGLTLAIGSVLALADFADTALVMHQMPPPETGQRLDIGTYGIVALIVDAASGFSWVIHALAGAAGVILVVLAIAAVFILALGVLLYLTGRGVGHHSRWARIFATLTSAGLVLVCCSMVPTLLAARQDLAPFAALPIGFCLYMLWVLIWRIA